MSKILVIDDEEINREMYAALLKNFGHEVITADDGQMGIELLELNPDVEVVITDYNMIAGYDGLSVLRDAKRMRPDVRVLIGSGNMTEELAAKAQEEGAESAFFKPHFMAALRRAEVLPSTQAQAA
jgi:CheY-like chemotaxis protein